MEAEFPGLETWGGMKRGHRLRSMTEWLMGRGSRMVLLLVRRSSLVVEQHWKAYTCRSLGGGGGETDIHESRFIHHFICLRKRQNIPFAILPVHFHNTTHLKPQDFSLISDDN